MNWFRIGWLLAIAGTMSASVLYARYALGYLNSDIAGFLVVFSVFAAGVLFPLVWITVKYYRRTEGDWAARGLVRVVLLGVLTAIGVGILSASFFLGTVEAMLVALLVGIVAVFYLRRLRRG